MLKTFFQRKKTDEFTAAEYRPSPSVSHIVVPQSTVEALTKDPYPLVQSVIDFTNHLTQNNAVTQSGLPRAARQAYHCDLYIAHVLSGGHAHFVGNLCDGQRHVVDEILEGLEAMGAQEFLRLAQKMSTWIEENPALVALQTGRDGGTAEALAALDVSFSALNRKTPLQRYIANWISARPELCVVDDLSLPATLSNMMQISPNVPDRQTAFEIIRLEQMFRNPLRLGLGMAAVAGAVPEPIVSINSSLPTQIDGRARNCWSLVTIHAARFGVMGRDTTSLHAYGAPKTGHVIAIRANAAHPIPTQIKTPDHDELGNTLFTVSNNDVNATQSICERLQVGAAINLLMHQLDHVVMVDFVSIRNACIDHANNDNVTAFVTSQGGTLVHRALIRPEGAVLFAEPDRSTLATVSRDMIDAHAAAHQIPDAV